MPTPPPMVTADQVTDYARYLANERHLLPRTIQGYEAEIASLVERQVPLERTALAAWISTGDRGEPLAPNTRNRRLVILRGFLKYLLSQGSIIEDPSVGIERGRVPRDNRSALGVAELRRVLAVLRQEPITWRRLRDEALFIVLFQTGLRVAELRSLDLAQVDTTSRVLRSAERKGGGRVDVPLNAEAFEALTSWLACRPPTQGEDAVFIGGIHLARLTVRSIQKGLAQLGKRAGLRVPLHPHVLRHAHATALLRERTPTEVIRQSLNHASLATTQRYLHSDQDLLREALDRLPRLDGQ